MQRIDTVVRLRKHLDAIAFQQHAHGEADDGVIVDYQGTSHVGLFWGDAGSTPKHGNHGHAQALMKFPTSFRESSPSSLPSLLSNVTGITNLPSETR
ncbi:hypothetical protein thsps21_21740 [Pseudomonas sp. No.21]|nr:hypothetical protein TUM20249_33170 [Pseudomonas tohonis]